MKGSRENLGRWMRGGSSRKVVFIHDIVFTVWAARPFPVSQSPANTYLSIVSEALRDTFRAGGP